MRRRTLAGLIAAVAAVTLVTTASIVWPGLDAKETPDVDASVWALQTGEGRRYARVNTAVGELDTVRSVGNPDLLAQAGDAVYLFSDSLSKVTRIDEAQPADIDDDVLSTSASTPAGTVDVATAGDFVAYLTGAGTVFAGRLSTGDAVQLDPLEDDAAQYTADAIAVDDRGILFSYSRDDASVVRYDIGASAVRGRDPLEAGDLDAPAVTAAGDDWVVVDTEDGAVWLAGAVAPASTDTEGAVVVSEPDADGDVVYVADESALIRVPVDGSPQSDAFRLDSVLGVPAVPVVHQGEVYAAWLGPAGSSGWLWSEDGANRVLEYGGGELPDQRRPVFVEGKDALLLNETRSGWAWRAPSGLLVPSSQDWTLDDRVEAESVPSEEQLPVMVDPKPPVAEPDAFGVRAGSLTTLPVLMNDHDPNEDVLSIDPASVTGLDPGFGSVTITDGGQRLAVRVDPAASGTATFSYAVTDGTADDGLASPPTTVSLTVSPEADNTAPQWCGVERCLIEWPEPEVARGGTITIPVLPGWVDPEGDPILLLSVERLSGSGRVAATPAGDVVYQHDDAGGGGEETVELAVTVADTRGASTTERLVVRVSPQPRLEVQSFAVVDVLGAGTTIDVAPHVSGTTGMLSLESVRVLDDAPATATVVGGTTEFDVVPRTPGTYRIDFTVTDGTVEDTGTVRVTVLPDDAPPQLATSPVVAFVHPQEDATIDVFAAVSNPTRRVLLLSDVAGTADTGATLSVDAVGQHQLRVSGTTATGSPGRLGTVRYTVSDGSEDEGATVQGEATVYLLPPAPELAPIAVDDSLVVRAGAQVDIPVLENDISPAGGRPTLDPSTVRASSTDVLAFASADVLRVLAPTEPGQYTIEYGVFTTGSPSLVDVATVRLQVLADDANRAPLPETLEGRVLSGQSTVIEFDAFGMDPDGDVVTLDRIVTQPDRGSAAISADGASIVYTSAAGDRGQRTFTYRVVDEFGDTGDATVRVGVLDEQSNPSPVTYTDYVQVQAGSANTIRVSPVANDVDPVGGRLTVTGVRPDLPASLEDGEANPEYARLADALVSVGTRDVVIRASDEPGTMSYLYDLESTSGNTARGLIVVKVVRESVPDYPVVGDTILTAETRDDFPTGVDVLTGKVEWAGGEVAGLDVALWGEPEDVRVSGRMLRGPLGESSRIVPFAVTGTGTSGEVTTYAFLRVPGDQDLSLALRSGTAAVEVDELSSTTFDMARLVAVPRGARIEVSSAVVASGARPEATCEVTSGTAVRYEAGSGAPWTDACLVPVRLVGQDDWTYLSVPVHVNALEPQPELRPASLTVGPGETATFDLRTLTTWQLREEWDAIQYAVAYTGPSFTVEQEGSVLTVTGADRAVPGVDEAAVVSVTSHTAAPARLILRVGAAPSTLPRGGTVTQQCSQAAGTSCTVDVVGAAGEVNPLPGTPLELVDVRDAGACVGVVFTRASATSVTATWTGDAPGATCAASFSLQDAQGRRTNGDRDGRFVLDLQGFPRAPASIAQTGYADQTVVLRVDPGDARLAYPAITGFVVRSGGAEVVRCAADGTCPAITAPNGEKRTYEAVAVNAVGTSATSVQTIAWAYDTPAAPAAVEARPIPASPEGGMVALTITGLETAETGSVEITSPAGETVRVPVVGTSTTLAVPSYRVGSNTRSPISVTPYSRFDLPPGLGGSPSGTTTVGWGNGVGVPVAPQLVLTSASDGDGTSTVTARGTAQVNGDGSGLRYGIVPEGQRCTVGTGGATVTFPGLRDGEEYGFTMCVESFVAGESFGRAEATASVRAEQTGRAPQGYTFAVDRTPDFVENGAQWVVRQQPTSSETPPNRNRAEFDGWPGTVVFGQDPGIRVRYVHELWGTVTPWSTVTPRAGSAPYQVRASWTVGSSCVGGGALTPVGTSSNDPSGGTATFAFGNETLSYYDAAGELLLHDVGTWNVPVGAVRVEGVTVSASWSQPWGLDAAVTTFNATCNPNNPPRADGGDAP